jgi:hypothetical protein
MAAAPPSAARGPSSVIFRAFTVTGCRRAVAGAAAVMFLSTSALPSSPAEAADEMVRGLQGLRRVAVEIAFSPAHPGVPVDDAQARVEEVLRGSLPGAPIVDGRSPERLRLMISVREVSSSELRGFYLPFSGSYGIGLVRLAMERMVTLPGVPVPVRAVVWQVERHARVAWRLSATEILDIAEDLAEAFVEDYRRAQAP